MTPHRKQSYLFNNEYIMADNDKQKFFDRLKNKYRLIIYQDNSLDEVWNIRLSLLNMFTFVGISAILLITLVTILIAFTPLKEFIPGFPDGNLQKRLYLNSLRVDSIENVVQSRTQYFDNLRYIFAGKVDSIKDPMSTKRTDDPNKYKNISFTKSKADSLLRLQVSESDRMQYVQSEPNSAKSFTSMHFFPPVRGFIVNKFNMQEQHFAIDIVAVPNEPITATLEGTIIVASWTLETGYVIEIQHDNNLISIYKHNSSLLKKVGDKVKAGESIAIIGNSGEFSTGPHLHFELWQNGTPINPENYISF